MEGYESSADPAMIGDETITNKVGSGVWLQPVVDCLPSDDMDLSGESL